MIKKSLGYFLTVGMLCAVANQASAQAALLAIIFGDKVASEKFHMSMDVGLNFSSLPNLSDQSNKTGLYFGLGTYVKINDKWALTPEFKPVSPRGAKKVLPLTSYAQVVTEAEYSFALNYIDVPMLAQYKISEKLFVSAGPQFSFLTSAKQVTSGKLQQGNTVDIEEKMKSNFESFYFSVPLEVGFRLSPVIKNKPMDLKVRYNIGVSEVFANTAYGSSKGSTFQVFLSFPFIKTVPAPAK
jgi:hypothetical protein